MDDKLLKVGLARSEPKYQKYRDSRFLFQV